MNKITLTTILAISFISAQLSAQTATWNYTVSGSNCPMRDTIGSVLIPINYGNEDDGTLLLNWPFAFSVYDNSYAAAQPVYMNTNGFISFTNSLAPGANNYVIPTNNIAGQFLSYGGNTDGIIVDGKVKSKVNGNAPNRVWTISLVYNSDYNLSGYQSFTQISFIESNFSIEFRYGSTISGTTTRPNYLGLNAGNNTHYNNLGLFPIADTCYTLNRFTPTLDAGIYNLHIDENLTKPQNVKLTLKNFGTTVLTSATINWSVNGNLQTAFLWSGSLTNFQSAQVNIGTHNFTNVGANQIKAWVTSPNGGTDMNNFNDTTIFNIELLSFHPLPLSEGFEAGFSKFSNALSNTTNWVTTQDFAKTGLQSVYNEYGASNQNILVETGFFDLSASGVTTLTFWHIAKTEATLDQCVVEISTDGGNTWAAIPASAYQGSSGDYSSTLYFHELSYIQWGTTNTIPLNTWWKQETFNLSSYNSSNMKLRFRLSSNASNHRYGWLIDDILIQKIQPPVVNLGNDTAFCEGGSVAKSAGSNPAYTYVWKYLPGNITIANTSTITLDSTGTYVAYVTDTYNQTTTDTIIITEHPKPIVSFSGLTTSLCNNQNPLSLTGTPSGGVFSGTGMSGSTFTAPIFPIDSLLHIKYVYSTPFGCSDSAQQSINVLRPPVVNLGNDTAICKNNTILLNAGSGSAWQWSSGGVSSSVLIDSTGSNGMPKLIRVTVTASNNCQNHDSIIISFLNLPQVNLGSDTAICENASIALNGGNGASYLWSNNATTASITVDSSAAINQQKTLWLELTGANSCKSRDTIVISFNSLPVSQLGNDTSFCVFLNDSLMLYGGVAGTYQWSTGASSPQIYIGPSYAAGLYNIKLSLTSAQACTTEDSILIDIKPRPSFSTIYDTACIYNQAVLNAGTGFNSYLWSTGATTPSISFPPNSLSLGIHSYGITVFNAFMCSTSDSAHLLIDACTGIESRDTQAEIIVYPNPGSGVFNLIASNNISSGTLSIFDAAGRNILNKELNALAGDIIAIDMSDYDCGIYMLILRSHSINLSRKVIIRK